MGTLFDQPKRTEHLVDLATWVMMSIGKLGFDPKNPDEVRAGCELLCTALKIQSADALDEQLAGFGNLLQELSGAVEKCGQTIARALPE